MVGLHAPPPKKICAQQHSCLANLLPRQRFNICVFHVLAVEQRARDVLETLDDDNDDDEIESPGRRPPSARRPPRPSEFGGDGGSKAGEAARKSSVVNDGFREYVRDVTAVRRKSVIQAAKLLAPTISASVAEGYDWVISEVKAAPSYAHLANELEIAKGTKRGELSRAAG